MAAPSEPRVPSQSHEAIEVARLQARVAELERQLRCESMPCGHHACAVAAGDEGTRYCAWCADVGHRDAEIGRMRRALQTIDARVEAYVAAGGGATVFAMSVADAVRAGLEPES